MLKLKEIRLQLHLTQAELAEKLNIKRNTICDWELGKSKPSIAHLKQLAILFSIPVDYLLDHPITATPIKNSLEISVKQQLQQLSQPKQQILNELLEKLERIDHQ